MCTCPCEEEEQLCFGNCLSIAAAHSPWGGAAALANILQGLCQGYRRTCSICSALVMMGSSLLFSPLLSPCGLGVGPEVTLLYYNTGQKHVVQEAFRLRILHVMQVSCSVRALCSVPEAPLMRMSGLVCLPLSGPFTLRIAPGVELLRACKPANLIAARNAGARSCKV